MAVQDIPTLKAQNDTKIYDNPTEDVTGTILHDLLRDILDSSLNRETDPYIVSNVLLIDPVNGDDATGRRGDFFRRYATAAGAQADALAGDTIHFLPGVHIILSPRGADGVNWHAWDGAFIQGTGTLFAGNGIEYNVTGRGTYTSNAWIMYTVGCFIDFHFKAVRSNSGGAGVHYAEGGQHNWYGEAYLTNYDGWVLDTSTGNAVGNDYMFIKVKGGRTKHTGCCSIKIGADDLKIKMIVEDEHIVGHTGGDGYGTFNVGGTIEFIGNMRREASVPDGTGAWHYAHGAADSGSQTIFTGRTELLCTDGSNFSEMNFGFRNDSMNDFTFTLTEGSYLHSHSFSEPTSTPIYWYNDVSGTLNIFGTVDQNGDAGSSTYCILLNGATTYPFIEFKNADLKQSGGAPADTVFLNGGTSTYLGKLLFRDGPFPVSFTNSITGLEVDY